MKIVAVVPIKLNNSRLPQKNIMSFTNGKPLCSYILNTLKEIKEIDEIYVYCSNLKIIKYLPDNIKFLKRSKNLDLDTTSMTDILVSFANEIHSDIYVMTHTTSPFVKPESIIKGLLAVKSGKFDSSFATKKVQDFLWRNGKTFNYELDKIPRTQDLEVLYKETSGFYIYNKSIIENMRRRIGEKPFLVEVDEFESIDIDEEEDFKLADAIFNYRKFIE